MKAFLLCAGLGTRLRPYTHHIPKTAMPFLNLPLLCYNWFYLEQLGVHHFYLNSHLFPDTLQKLVKELKQKDQLTKQVFEPLSLGSAGGLYGLKENLLTDSSFFYLNGDSLFFPSYKDKLSHFKNSLSSHLGVFYAVPFSKKEKVQGAFWIDEDSVIHSVGKPSSPKLKPVKFSGLAVFSNKIFNHIDSKSDHIFHDVMIPLLKTKKFKAFVDKDGCAFEGGSEEGLLEATEISLKYLFRSSSFLKITLEQIFKRFDPQDLKVGFEEGKKWYKKNKSFLLYPQKPTKNLKVKDFAVLGKDVRIQTKNILQRAVLGGCLKWQGDLKNKILVKF